MAEHANLVRGDDETNITRLVADYVVTARKRSVDTGTREATARCIFDLVGAAAAGIADGGAAAARGAALITMRPGAVPIWFTGQSTSSIGAAWANSAAAAALDLDDGHRLACGHPGAAVIPAGFAVAYEANASLEELMCAIAIGYEVGVSIAAARKSYGNTGTWSAYAVVAVASALLSLPAETIEHALAIAGKSLPNISPDLTPSLEGSDVKEGISWSVVTGLAAVRLACEGGTGPRNILDIPDHFHFPAVLTMGDNAYIRSTYFKLYSCCRYAHPAIDALLELLSQHQICPGSIDVIEVQTFAAAALLPNVTEPTHLVDVQYSVPYCLALAAIEGPEALLPLSPSALSLDDVPLLARKVRMTIVPELEARFPAETLAKVIISCGSRRYSSELTAPRGEATSQLSWEALGTKLRAATRNIATIAQQNAIVAALDDLRAGRGDSLEKCLNENLLAG